MTAFASQPGWWTTRDAVDPALGTNDYGVVNEGQLKQFLARAVDELNADLTTNGGAGPTLTNLVYGWQQDYLTNGYNATNLKPSDFNAMSVGQLKYIASLVYSPLASAGYTGLTPTWIVQNTNTDNLAATAGQLKQVFAWDITVPPATVTSVVATASNPGEIDLFWTNPTMNNATLLTIQQSTDGGVTWTTAETLPPTMDSYAMIGLIQGTSYEFHIIGSNPLGGSSAPSTPTTPTMAPITSRYAVIDLGQNFVPAGVTSQGAVGGNGPPTNNLTGALIPQVWQAGTHYYVNTNWTTGPVTSAIVTGIADSTNTAGYVLVGNGPFMGPATNPASPGYGPAPLGAYWPSASTMPTPIIGGTDTIWVNVYNHAISDQGFVVGSESYDQYGFQFNVNFPTNDTFFDTTYDVTTLTESGLPSSPYGTYPTGAAGTTNWCGYVTWGTGGNNGPIINGTSYTNNATFYPNAINDTNIVVGGMGANAVLTIPGAGSSLLFTNLGPGVAYALNNQLTTNVVSGVTNIGATPQIVGVDGTGTNGMIWDYTLPDGTPTTSYVAKNINLLAYGGTTVGTTPASWTIKSLSSINLGGAITGVAVKTSTGTTNGVLLVPVSITRDGLPIYPSNNTVWVGQQISLTNTISGLPTSAITSWKWSIPGANSTPTDTAFYDYEPNANNSNYTNLFTPTDRTTSSFIQYYWSSGGSNQVVYCTNVIYGQTEVIAATLNVSRPLAGIIAMTNAIVAADSNYLGRTDYPAFLHFGGQAGPIPGITFSQTNSLLPGNTGNFAWNQTNIVYISQLASGAPPYNATGSGVDTTFPYTNASSTSDSPGFPLGAPDNQVYEKFDSTMFLIWQPSNTMANGDKVIWVPLRGINWNWLGTATNSATGGTGTWALQSATNVALTNDYNATNEPIWNSNSTNFVH